MVNGGRFVMSAKDEQRLQVIGDYREGKISRKQAAALCQVSERTISRLTRSVRSRGPSGIVHANRGKTPVNRSPSDQEMEAIHLVKTRYFDFNLTHAWELLKERHGLLVSYDTFWRWCVSHGVGKRKKRRPSKARIARERMACRGMMLQMDGSHHVWAGSQKWCLIGSIDDASSEVPACRFFLEEDTFSTMSVLGEVIAKHGIPASVYVDRGKAFGGIKDEEQNQFRRACEELGIVVINALSPQAKGRIERMWRTFQDRLIPELRLLGITTIPAANRYLEEEFLPNYWNTRNIVEVRDGENRYKSLDPHLQLSTILCKKYYRRMRSGHLFDFRGVTYQLKSPVVGSIVGEQIVIHEYPDGTWKAFLRTLEAKVMPWSKARKQRIHRRAV